MWFRTDDPVSDFDNYDAECEEELERLPMCEACGERIQDDYLYDIDGYILCEECMNDIYRHSTENYMED